MKTGPVLAAGIVATMVAFVPAAQVATTLLADAPVSTASAKPDSVISADTGAPLGTAHDGTDPLVPNGTEPQAPVKLGYLDRNHDEGITTNGEVDVPF
jgi:hypothetical protein